MGQRLGLDRLGICENLGGTHREDAPGLGQGQATRGAVEQALADPGLEPGDSLGDGRLGKAEIFGGAGEGTGFGDFGEDGPGFEIGKVRHDLETMSFQRFHF